MSLIHHPLGLAGLAAFVALGAAGCGASHTAAQPSSSTAAPTSTASSPSTAAPTSTTTSSPSSTASAAPSSSPASASSGSTAFLAYGSHQSFTATIAALKHAVSKNGMMVMGNLNQAGALSTTGLHLKGAESFFVGNPVMGKKMFQMNAAVGAELPARVFVWVNSSGKTEVGYFQPSALLGAINPKLGAKGGMLNQKLSMIVKQVAAGSAANAPTVSTIPFEMHASGHSFSATVAALKHAVSKNGMMVMGNLNQAGALSTTGLHLKGAESFFVGNPVMGKKMFQMNAAVGAELPARVFVWVNSSGKTEVGYFQPSAVLGAINPKLGAKGGMLNQKLSMIVQQATS